MASNTGGAATNKDGGVDFEGLCNGTTERYYSFKLISLDGVTSMKEALDKLVTWLMNILVLLAHSKTIESFYIGKTSTRKIKACATLDPMDKTTMFKRYISATWQRHSKTKDGMVVFTIITKSIANSLGFQDAEECAWAIEEKLQKRFADDGRLENSTTKYSPGPPAKEADAYPLYLAYKYLPARRCAIL